MKTALLLLTLTLSSNAFSHGITPSEMYTIASLAVTLAPTASTQQMSQGARKIIAHVEEYSQNGEMTPELQELVKLVQAEDETISEQEAIDRLLIRAERILSAEK